MSSNRNSTGSGKAHSLRRIHKEWDDIKNNRSTSWFVKPLGTSEEDYELYEWHFTLRGPSGTEFEGGLYHGRLVLPPNYPFAPPDVLFLTPNGRFEINVMVCLSVTGFHPEEWQPAWSIRSILEALNAFLPTPADGVNSLNWPAETRRALASCSVNWKCPKCGESNGDIMARVCPPTPNHELRAGSAGPSTPPHERHRDEGASPDSALSTQASPLPMKAPKSFGDMPEHEESMDTLPQVITRRFSEDLTGHEDESADVESLGVLVIWAKVMRMIFGDIWIVEAILRLLGSTERPYTRRDVVCDVLMFGVLMGVFALLWDLWRSPPIPQF